MPGRRAFADKSAHYPGAWMYQMTDKDLAAEITAKGTKYYRNDELNCAGLPPAASALAQRVEQR